MLKFHHCIFAVLLAGLVFECLFARHADCAASFANRLAASLIDANLTSLSNGDLNRHAIPLVPNFEHIVIVVFENKEFGYSDWQC